ncbi:hypothetical protein VFPPC_17739 [Pochonia chlamydosporia 170]|uniref:Uncharacterized protein n=1 Tax=Pochonia chlamydosporia 170 TaxID=1380566 RepID=A0A219AS99_METCM|nr:hypothetical protein VFPPC_17739 [Pochonia chlamydosporia 170]OWT43085.1 hypothetical protein VFPPC_17739 [Pochonia chlamydosporia 170]
MYWCAGPSGRVGFLHVASPWRTVGSIVCAACMRKLREAVFGLCWYGGCLV